MKKIKYYVIVGFIVAVTFVVTGFREYDLVPGVDLTGRTNVTGALLYQLVGNAVLNTNKGLLIRSSSKPNIADNPRYTNYFWFDNDTLTLKYYQGPGDTFANWLPVVGVSAIQGTNIASHTITSENIGTNSIQEWAIAAGAVTSTKIADGAVVLGKLGPLAVTNGNLGFASVTFDKIQALTIQTTNIADGSITAAKLAAGAIAGAAITNGSVTADKIATNAIFNYHLNGGIIQASNIANAVITSNQIASSGIYRGNLHTNVGYGLVKCWGVIDGTGALLKGFNIASVSRTSAGNYTITFGGEFVPATANYCVTANANTNLSSQCLIVTVRTNTTTFVSLNVNNTAATDKDAVTTFQIIDY